jgi:HSP20 family molecular chaperone IbpA
MTVQTLSASDSYPSDWPGSPLSTLRSAASEAAPMPIRIEEFRRDGRYVARFELPGVDPDDGLEVSVDAQVLTVHAERKRAAPKDCHTEFRYGQYCTHTVLPAGADDSDVIATYDSGILEVSVGLAPEHTVRRVPVLTAPARES